MAIKRMFSLKIVDTDAFLDMPVSAQLLYFHLGMRADDDGFVANPKKILRMIGCNNGDAEALILKKFIIPFDSGVCVIKHWKVNNYIKTDRYKETMYLPEKQQLMEKENGSYKLLDKKCIQNVANLEPQIRLEKIRLDKIKKEKKLFVIPSLKEITAHIKEKGYHVDAESFHAFYSSKGWMVGKNKMKCWKSALVTWNKNSKGQNIKKGDINAEIKRIYG